MRDSKFARYIGVDASMGIGKRSIGCIIEANMKKNLKPPSTHGTNKSTG
jgi:hypothetical protein